MVLMRAKPAVWACLLAFGCGVGTALAQQPPANAPAPAAPAPAATNSTTPPTNLAVMVVDVQSLLQNSKAAKMVREQIEGRRAEYAKQISNQEETLRKERDTLQHQQASLSAEQLNAKGREFQAKVNELDRDVQAKRQALERSNADSLQKIQEVMVKIITEIAKDRKANLVFQRSELVLFDQGFDVTDQVLQKLDEQMPTLTVNFVAPVPAPAEAGVASPAAAQPAAAKPAARKK
ncbi:MAG TPA: OmpH family outer membrane protein [Stellaceae bacterium]|jgi:Skp family chaperone for outer membrane proteins|nr:OmpH family outer membrane protein [Stellaceae bacterium]